ncbi:MAG: hypothetical protein HKP58_14895 [Desulfatitalea sp.]|nr:hypothetical protein [Desulfatitalea sp.]NNK01695.1 hypothetical protein [Desulfatitalea sp.]
MGVVPFLAGLAADFWGGLAVLAVFSALILLAAWVEDDLGLAAAVRFLVAFFLAGAAFFESSVFSVVDLIKLSLPIRLPSKILNFFV